MNDLKNKIRNVNKKFHNGNRVINLLESYLRYSDNDVMIDDILQSLEDNLSTLEALDRCSQIVNKFTYKSIQTNYSYQWLSMIEKLLKTYHKSNISIPSQLYISKAACLGQFSILNTEIELCLNKAILASRSNLEIVEALIKLAYYYDGISAYKKMEETLLSSESLCKIHFPQHLHMAAIFCALGRHNFITLQFSTAMSYFEKSLVTLGYLEKTKDDLINTVDFGGIYNSCLHYLGRIKLERCQFKECINLYVQAETKFIDHCRILKINYNTGATAFYHLRMAQVLEICGLVNSADYHYQQSSNLFQGINPLPAGKSQVKLSLSQQESQIKESIQENIEIGYSRGYLLSCTKLFTLYANQLKIHLAFRLIFRIVFDVVRDKSINITFSTADFTYLFILSRQMILGHYGLGIYTRLKILQLKLFKSNEMITVCPCPEPDCKKHIRVVMKEQ